MTRHGFALLALAIIAIASWAYHVNYNTRDRLERIAGMRADIARERESLQVLRVEWAYLNNPERLARLVKQHNRRLNLVPMQPKVLGFAAAVPFTEREPEAFDGGTDGLSDDPADDRLYVTINTVRYPVPMFRPAGWRPE